MSATSTVSRSITRNAYGAQEFALQTALDLSIVSVRDNSSTDFAENSGIDALRTTPQKKEVVVPYARVAVDREADIDAAVIQLWEGRVLDVDRQHEVMSVSLTAKMGQIPEHTAEIELQWVSEQDLDLVVPGAIFYLTLYKKTRRGSIQNSQELRFRRRPSWTKQQVQKIYSDAEKMLAKMRSRPIAA
jgi:hypothetical protein